LDKTRLKSRRRFFRTAAGSALVVGALTDAAAVPAGKRFRWRMVTAWPPNFPIFQEGAERLARDVKLMSAGRLSIQVFAGGQLVPPLQTFDAVSQGTVEMGHAAAFYWAGTVPAAQFFSAVPFGLNAQGMNAWFYSGGGLDLWREVYAPYNLVPFPVGNTGVQMGGWFRKKINSLADLKGLKMRIPGIGGKVMAKAGVNPVLMAGGELYTALERGAIEAAEWAGPYHDLRLGLYRAAPYYYYPGWHEPGPAIEMIVNRSAWEKLPRELQLILEAAAAASNLSMLSEFEAKNLQALRTLQTRYKVKTYEFPRDVIRGLRKFTHEVLREEAAKDKLFSKTHMAYRAFLSRHDAWGAISEGAYATARKG